MKEKSFTDFFGENMAKQEVFGAIIGQMSAKVGIKNNFFERKGGDVALCGCGLRYFTLTKSLFCDIIYAFR